ncbi:TIGR03435 family protein [Terriglobus roseus]|nr:TIGR03435 family protein [Terriglobus roseus]
MLPLLAPHASGQSQPATPRLSFDTASVHETKPGSEEQNSNVPLGPGNVYSPTGGLLVIHNYPLMGLISFAYRMTTGQQSTFADMAPAWVRDTRYSIVARTEKTDVTKDELRLMMRSLLAQRFAMAVHYESRLTPVFAAQLVKPGQPGPRLRPHPADGCSRAIPKEPADGATAAAETIDGGFPAICGGLLMMSSSTPTHFHIGARDVSIVSITSAMASWGDLAKPVVDQTGLAGNYDFAMEFTPKRPDPAPGAPAPPSEGAEPNFLYALRTQLGIKLEAQKQPVEVLLLDRIERLSEN